jgi:hypothetical protein
MSIAAYSTETRRLGQAIFGTWTRHSTPGHMPNLRAAGRLIPVARASDGVLFQLRGAGSTVAAAEKGTRRAEALLPRQPNRRWCLAVTGIRGRNVSKRRQY